MSEVHADVSIESLCKQAHDCLSTGNVQKARQYYFQALALSPDAPGVHHGLATCCFLLGDFNGAVYHFQEVLRHEPQRVGAAINLGAVYNQMGKPDEALVILRQIIKQDSKRAEAYYNMGIAYRLKGMVELAIQSYREAVHNDPRMAEAHFNLANILHELGRDAQAVRSYQLALELSPNHEAARIGLQSAQASLAAHQQHQERGVGSSATIKSLNMSTADLLKPVDPNVDGPALANLHRTTISAENAAREMHRVIEEELEPVIKELSARLMDPKTDKNELASHLGKFETLMNKTRATQKQWQQQMQSLREHTDAMMQPAKAAF